MKRYWQFLIVGAICLLAALLWAQPPSKEAQPTSGSVTAQSNSAPTVQQPASSKPHPGGAADKDNKDKVDGDDPLPGSSSSLPLLAVIGFGVLAGGITSAMRTRE